MNSTGITGVISNSGVTFTTEGGQKLNLTNVSTTNTSVSLNDKYYYADGNSTTITHTKPYSVINTDDSINIEIIVPGVKSEDIKVLFQKENYTIKFVDRYKKDNKIVIPLTEIERQSNAFIETVDLNEIILSHGILTIRIPYKVSEISKLQIKEI